MKRSVLRIIGVIAFCIGSIAFAAVPAAAKYPVAVRDEGDEKPKPPDRSAKFAPVDPASPRIEVPAELRGRSLCADDLVRIAAEKHGMDPKLVRSVVIAESGGNPRAFSHKGAAGCMQLMPGTARDLGVQNRFDPWQNIAAGTKYLRDLLDRFNGDLVLALAGYNAGEGAVEHYRGVPPYAETRGFVRRVLALFKGSDKALQFGVAVAHRGEGGVSTTRVSRRERSGDPEIVAAEKRIEEISRQQQRRNRVAHLERLLGKSEARAASCAAEEEERIAHVERRAVRYANRFAGRPDSDIELRVANIRADAETCALREKIAQIRIKERLAEAQGAAEVAPVVAVPYAPAPSSAGWVLSSADPESGTAIYVRSQQ